MKEFFHKYKHVWILSYGLVYLTWFFHLERTVTKGYHVIHVRLDDYIPFEEIFIVPYLLWFAYVTAAVLYLFFTNKEEYYRLCIYLFSGMTISLIICTFYHNGTDFRPVLDADKNIFTQLVRRLYIADTPTNVFPSIHVYNSICTHVAISRSEHLRRYPAIQWSSFTLMVLICMATVFLKQHSVIDVLGGCIMAYILYYVVYGYGYGLERKKASPKILG
ncbi:MAG: phosphatase PAP2 family protein [Lachnospiraceae bacterium]|nr:phosphatase PAP2 family protein [Lachnospiraceae bacterium]MCI9591317.1 phosphatase PAP2 family protein [Lachnospiraceae bacterium]